MKITITQKAENAIDELNQTALLLQRQMKSGEPDKETADKAICGAARKVKTFRRPYFSRTPGFEHLRELQEFNSSELDGELETANSRFGKVLKQYAKAVGADFQQS